MKNFKYNLICCFCKNSIKCNINSYSYIKCIKCNIEFTIDLKNIASFLILIYKKHYLISAILVEDQKCLIKIYDQSKIISENSFPNNGFGINQVIEKYYNILIFG